MKYGEFDEDGIKWIRGIEVIYSLKLFNHTDIDERLKDIVGFESDHSGFFIDGPRDLQWTFKSEEERSEVIIGFSKLKIELEKELNRSLTDDDFEFHPNDIEEDMK